MANVFSTTLLKAGGTAGVQTYAGDAIKDLEIINRLDRTDQALGELQNAVEALTIRLSPVMTDAVKGDGNDAAESGCNTPIGRRLQDQERDVRGAIGAVQSILQRLEI